MYDLSELKPLNFPLFYRNNIDDIPIADYTLYQIEKGFLTGANASGQLLDSIKEYTEFFQKAGFSRRILFQFRQKPRYNQKTVWSVKTKSCSQKILPLLKQGFLRNRWPQAHFLM